MEEDKQKIKRQKEEERLRKKEEIERLRKEREIEEENEWKRRDREKKKDWDRKEKRERLKEEKKWKKRGEELKDWKKKTQTGTRTWDGDGNLWSSREITSRMFLRVMIYIVWRGEAGGGTDSRLHRLHRPDRWRLASAHTSDLRWLLSEPRRWGTRARRPRLRLHPEKLLLLLTTVYSQNQSPVVLDPKNQAEIRCLCMIRSDLNLKLPVHSTLQKAERTHMYLSLNQRICWSQKQMR